MRLAGGAPDASPRRGWRWRAALVCAAIGALMLPAAGATGPGDRLGTARPRARHAVPCFLAPGPPTWSMAASGGGVEGRRRSAVDTAAAVSPADAVVSRRAAVGACALLFARPGRVRAAGEGEAKKDAQPKGEDKVRRASSGKNVLRDDFCPDPKPGQAILMNCQKAKLKRAKQAGKDADKGKK